MSNIFKLWPTHFSRGAKNFLGLLRPPWLRAWYKHTHSAQRWLIKTDKTERFKTALEADGWITAVKLNSWVHAICACTSEQHSTYQIRWENWWLRLRIWCLGKCVGLGLMLQLEKENNWCLKLSPAFFTGFTYYRTVHVVGIWHLSKKF